MVDLEEFEIVVNQVVSRFKGFVTPAVGLDDLRQEARLGVLEAIDCYKPGAKSLRHWVYLVAYRKCIQKVRYGDATPQRNFERKEHKSLQQRLYDGRGDEIGMIEDQLACPYDWSDPWKEVVRRQTDREGATVWERFVETLSEFERSVLRVWAEGQGIKDKAVYKRIISELGCTRKQADNALCRIKKKIKANAELADWANSKCWGDLEC